MENFYKYEMIIYWSKEENIFIVEVPELSGCTASGETYEEPVRNALQVIKEWLILAKEEGREIPTPKGRLLYA